jgi:hypothetical protein
MKWVPVPSVPGWTRLWVFASFAQAANGSRCSVHTSLGQLHLTSGQNSSNNGDGRKALRLQLKQLANPNTGAPHAR